MSSLVCVTSGALSIWVLTCASLAAADWLSRSVFRFLSQIYQEDMMRSLLQNSLHVFRAISGTSTDLGWCLSHWPPSISATCPHCSLEDVNSKASGQLSVSFSARLRFARTAHWQRCPVAVSSISAGDRHSTWISVFLRMYRISAN